ncbi:MAG: ATP synthase F1 subunit delta [Desulfosudaceae bacterium]
MRNFSISRRYSKALILIGKDDGQAEQYRDQLNDFVAVLDQEKDFEVLISNPLYPAEARKKSLEVIIDKIGLSDVLKSFLLLLFEKGRMGDLRGIVEFYQKLVDEYKGVVQAEVISASKLSDDAVEKIKASLSRMTGKEVMLNITQDTALIGGVVTRVGDMVLDGSIKTQLENMKESLKKGERV